MQLRKIKLQNVKHFRDFELDLVDPRSDSPRQWTLVVGKNGRGKSTLLQAIALATLGVNQANSVGQSLLPALWDARGGRPSRDVAIEAELELPKIERNSIRRTLPFRTDTPRAPRLRSTLALARGRNELTGAARWADLPDDAQAQDPLVEARSRGLPWWLVAGYGTYRDLRTRDRAQRPTRPAEDRVAGLFRPHDLIGLGFADLIQEIDGGAGSKFRSLMHDALTRQDHLVPDLQSIELRGHGGLKTTADILERRRFVMRVGASTLMAPPTWLSHGYQASIAWIADLIGQYFLDVNGAVGTAPKTEHISGLVLIDELDLFLHPEWQLNLIDALSATFRNVQFIATTHSPILVSGRSRAEIVSLELNDDGDVERRPIQYDPRLLTPGELYRQVLGVHETPPGRIAEDLDRLRVLAGDPQRDDAEQAEVDQLRKALAAVEVSPLPEILPRGPR